MGRKGWHTEKTRQVVAAVWAALGCAIGVGPAVLLAAAWPGLPETVPMHWGAGLEPDRWSSRLELWVVPAICLGGMLATGVALAVLARRSEQPARDVLTRDRNDAMLWFVPHAIFAPAAVMSALQLGVVMGTVAPLVMTVAPLVVGVAEIPLLAVLGDWKTLLHEHTW